MDIDEEFRRAEERIAIKINRMYMEALARVYNQPIQTILIRHALGYL